jgi:hypothetical protein
MEFDATGIEPTAQGQSKLFPKQWFTFKVIEHTTNDGRTYPLEGFTKEKKYPKVDLLCECIDQGEYFGERVFHTVTFLPKGKDGSGMSVHWLKTINQPYEGKIEVNPQAWVGEQFMGYPIVDEYQGKKRNKFGEVKAVEVQRNPDIVKAERENDVPY